MATMMADDDRDVSDEMVVTIREAFTRSNGTYTSPSPFLLGGCFPFTSSCSSGVLYPTVLSGLRLARNSSRESILSDGGISMRPGD